MNDLSISGPALEEMTMLDSTVHSTTALLVYDDLTAAHEYLIRVFGLTAGPLQRDGDGRVVHAEIRARDQVIWLHPQPRATSRRASLAQPPA
jgi:MerR family transcriptional regulator, thiopeptide resistance regulator